MRRVNRFLEHFSLLSFDLNLKQGRLMLYNQNFQRKNNLQDFISIKFLEHKFRKEIEQSCDHLTGM